MRKTILISLALVSVIFSAASHAERTVLVDVINVIASADGGGLATVSSNLEETTGGVCVANARYQIDPTSQGAKGHLATLLTAKASGAQIKMDIVDCSVIDMGLVSPTISNVLLF